MVIWPDARAHMAHHYRSPRSNRRFRARSKHFEHCRTLRGMLHLPNGRLFGQFGHYRLGFLHAEPDEGEEGGRSCYDECGRTGKFYSPLDV
jgi:hypothetical protein